MRKYVSHITQIIYQECVISMKYINVDLELEKSYSELLVNISWGDVAER